MAATAQWLWAEEGGGNGNAVMATANEVAAWETFRLAPLGNEQLHILTAGEACLGYPLDNWYWDMARTFACVRQDDGQYSVEWEGKGVVWNVVRTFQWLEPPIQGVCASECARYRYATTQLCNAHLVRFAHRR